MLAVLGGEQRAVVTYTKRRFRLVVRCRNRGGGLGFLAARYLSTDVTLVRIIIAALALFTGAGAALYLVAWLLIPAEGYDQSIAAAWIASRNREGESR